MKFKEGTEIFDPNADNLRDLERITYREGDIQKILKLPRWEPISGDKRILTSLISRILRLNSGS